MKINLLIICLFLFMRICNIAPAADKLDRPAAHIFKIKNGKIYEIEAIGYAAKHGLKNGWE